MTGANALRYLPHPQIVAIDNNPAHLNEIRNGLFKAGLPCLTLLYDKMEGLEIPLNGWIPDKIRIIFLDLNLGEVDNPNAGDAAGPISEVLEKIYGQGNHIPFIIFFWTTHSHLVQEVMKNLYERYHETPLPVYFATLVPCNN